MAKRHPPGTWQHAAAHHTDGRSRSQYFSEVGRRIRARRLELGLTQRQVARELGTCPAVLCRAERNGTELTTILMICRLAQALDLEPAELAFGEGA